MVSIESPLVVVKKHLGLRYIVKSVIMTSLSSLADLSWLPFGRFVPVQRAAPFIHEKRRYIFSAIALSRISIRSRTSVYRQRVLGLSSPSNPPYSEAAFVRVLLTDGSVPVLKSRAKGDSVFLSVCSLRVGTFSLDHSTRLHQVSRKLKYRSSGYCSGLHWLSESPGTASQVQSKID
jgi:hypothetical protein